MAENNNLAGQPTSCKSASFVGVCMDFLRTYLSFNSTSILEDVIDIVCHALEFVGSYVDRFAGLPESQQIRHNATDLLFQ
jgi:hypothetical protein